MGKFEKLLEGARPHLDQDETILQAVMGAYETKIMGSDTVRNGILVATQRRVLFFAKKLAGFDLESFPLTNISSIEMSKGMMGHKISLFASGNRVDVKWVNPDPRAFVQEVRQRMGRREEHAAPIPNPKTAEEVKPDPIVQIRKLAELRDEGILSDEEFNSKKAELLRQM